jgi:putative component of membrane protein insertase Oxa1/YidC/SpoIIIJ protein YidD
MWAEWPRRGLMLLVRGYRLLLSPWLGNNCRFDPTCSTYALGALVRWLAATSHSNAWAAVGLGVPGVTIPCLRRHPPCSLA